MQRTIFTLFWVAWATWTAGQSGGERIPIPKTSIKLSYLGNISHPGVKAGLDFPYKVIQREKSGKKGLKTVLKERSVGANLGFYHHPHFHDNLFLLLEQTRRRQSRNGWFSEFAPGLGFSRTFLGGTTYQVSASGSVNQKKLAGYNYGMFTLAAGGGYNLAIRNLVPVRIYGKLGFVSLFPFNSSVHVRLMPEVGLTYSPGHFLKSNPTIKIRKK